MLCIAHRRNGDPCKRPPMKGRNVCSTHGGRAPQVRRRAQQRIAEAADKAAFTMEQIMMNLNTSDRDKIAAAKDLLDRNGFTSKQELSMDVRVSKFEQISGDILMDVENLPELEATVVEDERARPMQTRTDDEIEAATLERAYRPKDDQQIADEDTTRRRHHRNVQRRKG
ncbi:HGGxSTG domain-containing protein [Rathayibacter sp. VKM Ac-2927]|uniref:HGGxSTG domain-containing protein n=1 Tax=Rathayibacter sp. VKM Ac-2927 TaxID=2929478 RepID=UPI0027E06CA0|nr:HGGxSTG domain-containing protein [Rathayibacter sp. VKM Ac-2927]